MYLHDMIRIIFLIVAFSVLVIKVYANDSETQQDKKRYSSPVLFPIYAPILILVWLILSFLSSRMNLGVVDVEHITIYLIDMMLCLSVYLLGLMVGMPKLSNVNPMILALLWVLPDLNYMHAGKAWFVRPDVVLKVPDWLIHHLDLIFIVWLIGFICVMIYKIGEHLLFRTWILRRAEFVKDQRIIKVWKQEKQLCKVNIADNALLVSSSISSPFTIGLFPSTSWVILPNKDYTDDQLSLIFRHELVHISRYDSLTKLFVWFCIALCWFNPLIYHAMKKCSFCLEMSCDELVLYREDNQTRRMYADLILNGSCEKRGFTTCLSASFKGIKQRLDNVLSPRKKTEGTAILVVCLCAVMLLQGGVVFASAADEGDYVFLKDELAQAELVRIQINGVKYNASSTDERKQNVLMDYLCQLSLIEVYSGIDDRYLGSSVEIVYRYGFKDSRIVTVRDIGQGMLIEWCD